MGERLTSVASGLGTRASPFGPFTRPTWFVATLVAISETTSMTIAS